MQNKHELSLFGAPLLLTLGLTACGGNGVAIQFSADEGPSAANALVIRNEIDLSRLEVMVRELKALPESGDENNEKLKVKGEYTLNLLDGSQSTIPDFELENGTYKKIEFKISKPDAGGGIDGTDAALWMEGAKDTVAFRFTTDSFMKITLRHENGISVGEGADEDFLVDLAVGDWFAGVDMASLELDANNVAVIEDGGANDSAHDRIRANLTNAIKLLRKPR